jgi:dTDP-4-amino-4,6-dideoxygalactose transaminase/GNAT superfamily N-acetyltransferase
MCDVKKGTFHIDYNEISEKITEKTKVIIPVDIGGVMVNYKKIFKIVKDKKELFKPSNPVQEKFGRILVLSDSAHSFGAVRDGIKAGAYADFSAFSFHAVKNLTTAEGGAITWRHHEGIDDEELYRWFMLYSLHGQSKDALSKMQLGSWEYDIVYPAYKCNMTDITAAMGIMQLKRFDGLMEKRKSVIREYDKELLPLGIERLLHFRSKVEGNGHLYLMRIPGITEKQRNEIIVKMAEAGIATNVHFKPLPMHTAYKKLGFDIKDYPNAYAQYCNEITLPLHTLLTKEEVKYVAATMKRILEGKYVKKAPEKLKTCRVRETDIDSINTVQMVLKECGEEMFMRYNQLHWATPLNINVIVDEALTKEVYLVMDENEDVVATFNISEKPSMYFDLDKKALYFQRLGVVPSLWRRGVGSRIYKAIEERARKDGCECIRCTVYSESNAVYFLQKQGFKLLYKRPSRHFVLFCMEKELDLVKQ